MVWQSAQTRCFTYVTDAIEGTLLAGTSAVATGNAFNIGSTQETTVGEAVDLIAKLTGFDSPAIPVSTGEKLGPAHQDLARRIPDTAKARTLLGWNCENSLHTGLTKTIEWARAKPWWLAMPDSGAA
jgi:UDP-glucose 4-epimerase